MVELSYKHIEVIKNEVCNAGITYSHLQYDLIDHICCDIENEMQKGLAFEKAYSEVKQKFSLDGLQKIQEETLLLIDKKYRIMKTTMKIFGVIAPILIAFGTLFKIEHWPGASILLTIGFFLLTFVFLPSTVYVSYREVSNGTRKFAHIAGFLAGFLVSISFLFKIQHWPGTAFLMLAGILVVELVFLPLIFWDKIKSATTANQRMMYALGWLGAFIYLAGFLFKVNHWPGASVLLLSGALIFLVIAFPFYVYAKYKDEEKVNVNFIFITVAVVWIVLPTMLISLNFSQDALKGFKEMQNETVYHIQYVTNQNSQIYKKLKTGSGVESLTMKSRLDSIKRLTDDVVDYLEKVKGDMKTAAETSGESNGILTVLYGSNNNGEGLKIKDKMEYLKKGLILIPGLKQSSVQLISSLLSTDPPKNKLDGWRTWEDYTLKTNSLTNAYGKLNFIRDNVRIAENIALQDLLTGQVQKISSLTNHK
jgi:uncharacterized membrane protein (DUF106 family)